MAKSKLCLYVVAASLPMLCSGCASTKQSGATLASNEKPSWSSRLVSVFKSDDKAGPKQQSLAVDDPTSLTSKTKTTPEIHVAVAEAKERNGDFDGAEKQYQIALKQDPNNLAALLGHAHCLDRKGDLDGATKRYQKAIAKYPNEAACYNDLGLCFHRRGMLGESVQTLNKAVELRPTRTLYRNNLATVYIELGQTEQALAQLTAAHGSAVAHYNIAYLLTRKGDEIEAQRHFALAAQQDPSLSPVEQAIAQTNQAPSQPAAYTTVSLPPAQVVDDNAEMRQYYYVPPAQRENPPQVEQRVAVREVTEQEVAVREVATRQAPARPAVQRPAPPREEIEPVADEQPESQAPVTPAATPQAPEPPTAPVYLRTRTASTEDDVQRIRLSEKPTIRAYQVQPRRPRNADGVEVAPSPDEGTILR